MEENMGQIKNAYMEDGGLKDYLEKRIQSGDLNSMQIGIAKIVIDNGIDKLSDKQKYVFDNYIDIEDEDLECPICQTFVPSSDLLKNNGMCDWCANRKN